MRQKISYLLFILFTLVHTTIAQDLPKGMTVEEARNMPFYLEHLKAGTSARQMITTPPPYTQLRNAAEWEEIQTLNITWTSYTPILKDIIKAAQQQTRITIICSDSLVVKNYLTSNSVPLTNLKFVIAPFNSVWARDYSANPVYGKYVDSLFLVDWIYNRPRPNDNATPVHIANAWNLPLYETTVAPWDLIHTGGNYMSDGFGTAFSSNLILTENPSKSAAQIDTIMKKFMGINRYIRMPVLPYDGIHHIDMHMKLLDEETLLWGQYPVGIADGPQIEANLQFILSNYNSVFGTPYKIVRIPMPMDKNGKWPNQAGGWYCTYTNGVFVNKTYIFPTYYQQYDTTAFRILKQALPGYNIVGIDCDNGSSPIISASGAIHCITHSIAHKDPLLISHQALPNQCDTGSYLIKARILHKSGIQSAKVFWTNDTLIGFTAATLTLSNAPNNEYRVNLPALASGNRIYYYIEATANSGKTMQRPITAPLGRYTFSVNACALTTQIKENEKSINAASVYPNPASAITCIPVKSKGTQNINVTLKNTLGQTVDVLYEGVVTDGDKNIFLFADKYSKGVYFIEIKGEHNTVVQKVLIR
ncbi:MAG: agmatine deiminase family protein [Sediminibacterium sp.]|nr:agmatine deiminase family protein [Sediminibacterium sp.]